MRRHSQLYAHEEEDPSEDGWDTRQYPAPPLITSTSSSAAARNRNRTRLGPPSRSTTGLATPGPSFGPSPSSQGHSDLYSQYLLRYRSSDTVEDPRDDPDSHYFQRGTDQLQDTGDSDDEETRGFSSEGGLDSSGALDSDLPQPANEKDRERLEWQAMLASVLAGDVLKSEKTRIASVIESSGDQLSQIRQGIWLGIRAKLSGRSELEEKKKLEERRLRVVSPVIGQVRTFTVSPPEDSESPAQAALQQVALLLHRLDIAHSLYPNWDKFFADKSAAADAEFQARIDTLNTWSNIMVGLRNHIRHLQRWTGSQTLDVTAHNTSSEIPIPVNDSASPARGTEEVADTSSFIERLLKEETMLRTFEKGALWTIHNFLATLRSSQIDLYDQFKEMKLPTFEHELLPLLGFPTKLVQGALEVRIQYATRLGSKPDNIIIDQTLEDLKVSIGLACTLKRQYEEFLNPDSEGKWRVPPCLSEDYDRTILEGLRCLFNVISAKLRHGRKAIYFKETDLLESYWATFDDVSLTVDGGSRVVAELLCSLTNRLMVRVTNYFDTQVRVPSEGGLQEHHHDQLINGIGGEASRKMTNEQIVTWYGRVLESVRIRSRKLQRFARALTQRFGNSAEYDIEDLSIDQIVDCLTSTNHFLVYTHPPGDVQNAQSYEEDGLYLVASESLWDRPSEYITNMLAEAFRVDDPVSYDGTRVITSSPAEFRGHQQGYDDAEYILVLSPCTHWVWRGRMRRVPMMRTELEIKENHIRLIANGSQRELMVAKDAFRDAFLSYVLVDEEGEPVEDSAFEPPKCLVEQQAHLPTVNRELRKITRSTNKLAESIVDSVHHVRSSLRATVGCQELLELWYQFASDHGNHALKYMDRSAVTRFCRLLIKLAISWVSFICDDCDPNDRKTFKWAVNALEFTSHRTKRNLLQLPDEQFEMLRQKVSNCMTLLISHFDILGARSTIEATREKERQEEVLRARVSKHEALEDEEYTGQVDNIMAYTDSSTRLFWDRLHRAVEGLEGDRVDIGLDNNHVGRVLDKEKPEDRSLMFLANSTSNVSVRWQQGRFIGAGAFGSVYMAVNLDSGTVMAVKEVKFQEIAGAGNLYSQIKDELRVMEVLHHPNVVEYYGIEVHRDKVYIFEEYCQGGSLAELLEHGRIEDERIIQVYTMHLLEGLAYLHSQGVVHRDIKPDNILLDHMGALKYADFGAAKIFAKNTRTMQRSHRPVPMTPAAPAAPGLPGKQNSLTGTPMYMSPEVIKNEISGRFGAMDVWSLGCVVLEFATGKKPWSNLDNEWAIMFHIGVATQHPPLPEPDQLSDLGIDFIKQCLAIDTYARPSAVELMDHPWMLDFREALLSYEEAEGVQDGETTADGTFELVTAEREAILAEEIESVEDAGNFTGSGFTTPSSASPPEPSD